MVRGGAFAVFDRTGQLSETQQAKKQIIQEDPRGFVHTSLYVLMSFLSVLSMIMATTPVKNSVIIREFTIEK